MVILNCSEKQVVTKTTWLVLVACQDLSHEYKSRVDSYFGNKPVIPLVSQPDQGHWKQYLTTCMWESLFVCFLFMPSDIEIVG